jgi:hypothetical protein
MGVFCEKFLFLKESFPKLRHLRKKSLFWGDFLGPLWHVLLKFSCWKLEQEGCRVSFKDFFNFKIYNFFLGTQQQTLLTSCWRRPQVKPNSREPAAISPARHWVWTQELLRILWCSQSDNYSQNNLAKFDNVLDMKVEETRIVLYFYYQPGTYHTNLAIWKIIQCLANLGPFSHEKSLVEVETLFFKSQIGKNSPVKEKL